MDASFHEGLDRELLLALSERRDAPGLVRVSAQLLLLLAGGALLVSAPPLSGEPGGAFAGWGAGHWLAALSGLALSSLANLSLFATLHESTHGTAFRRRWLNEAAAWFGSLAGQVMPPQLMREFHFAHHRHTHDLAQDPELGGLEFMASWPRGLLWLGTISGLPVLLARVAFVIASAIPFLPAALWERGLPFVRARQRRRVAWESRLWLALHAGFVALAWSVEPRLLRVYLGFVVGHALLSVYITCEHRGLPHEGSILARTRTLEVGAPLRWLLWNMPYHAAHHAYPNVPFHALPRLQSALEPRMVHAPVRVSALHWRAGEVARAGSS